MESRQLKVEHYKAIRTEYNLLIQNINKLWFRKLSSVAVIILIAFVGQYCINSIGEYSQSSGMLTGTVFIAMGFLATPLISFIFDLKMLENAFYLELISRHMTEEFSKIQEIMSWENMTWGDASFSFKRTLFSFLMSVGISVVVYVMAFLVVVNLQPEWKKVLLIVSIPIVLVPFIALFRLIPKFMK